MTETKIQLPKDVELHMEDCTAEAGTKEWFQEAFQAVVRCAIDNSENLKEEFYRVFGDEFEDDESLDEAVNELKWKAGLNNLG